LDNTLPKRDKKSVTQEKMTVSMWIWTGTCQT